MAFNDDRPRKFRRESFSAVLPQSLPQSTIIEEDLDLAGQISCVAWLCQQTCEVVSNCMI